MHVYIERVLATDEPESRVNMIIGGGVVVTPFALPPLKWQAFVLLSCGYGKNAIFRAVSECRSILRTSQKWYIGEKHHILPVIRRKKNALVYILLLRVKS